MQVHMTRQGADDVEAIYSYIARRSESGADSWYEAFFAARAQIQINPESYPLTESAEYFAGEVREHYFRTRYGRWNYCVLFTTVGDIIYVVRVHGPGENFAQS